MLTYILNHEGIDRSSQGLWESLCVPDSPNMIVSLVGGGGKTSVMYQLAQELSRQGKRVIVTTSTHISYPKNFPVMLMDQGSDFLSAIRNSPIVVTGKTNQHEKIKGLPVEQITELKQYADVILVEADGAKQLPLKVPADHEPVIVPESSLVIACAGLDSIGETLEKTCFRIEPVSRFLNKDKISIITQEDMVKILTSEHGSKKQVGSIPYRIILNKADTEDRRRQGLLMMQELYHQHREFSLMTMFRRS